MGRTCTLEEYLDELLNQCVHCQMECKQEQIIPRCTNYCEIANCRELPGRYYDGLLKRCVECAEVCGNHPEECNQYCTTPKPPVASTKLLAAATSPVLYSRVPSAVEDSTILVYMLLAVCLLMLFTSLTLAVVVLLRRARVKDTSVPAPRGHGSSERERARRQNGRGVVQIPGPTWQSSKEFMSSSNCPTMSDHEPLDDTSPTETCIHCFPDLRAIGHDRPVKAPVHFYPQTAHHAGLVPNRGSVWTGGNVDACGQEV